MQARPVPSDLRRTVRRSTHYRVIAEHRMVGDLPITITNISADGFIATGVHAIGRGERVIIRLPTIGRIEAHLIWVHDGRAGFQFERILRAATFAALAESMKVEELLLRRR